MNTTELLMLFYAHQSANINDGLSTSERVKKITEHLRLVKSVLAVVDWESLEPSFEKNSKELKKAKELLK